ncbi:flagellar biosynthesis regulator FlhF [Campylobacter jejuni subsp. doylei]|nr:flagellar biosynthesis regulator FlhF [Campylobacter jejuni subsp. doylei]
MGHLIHTFTVEDTEQIIPKVKEDYGDKALIITNKQIRPKTLNHSALYEVMVAIEESNYEEHLKKQGKSLPAKKSSPKSSSTSLAEEKIRSQIPQEDVVELNQLANDPLEILIGDKRIAYGEVVIVDGNFGVQITEIGSKKERLEQLR